MTDIDTLAALLRGAAPALAIGEFLEEAAWALTEYDDLLTKSEDRADALEAANGELAEANSNLQDEVLAAEENADLKAAAAEIFSAYLVSIGQPAVPVVCANPHLEALAELLLP